MTVPHHQPSRKAWAMVLHGGAGRLPAKVSAERAERYRQGLSEAREAGCDILRQGGTSLEAVEQAVVALEDNPLFNAGCGAVFHRAGGHELDASIMDGRTLGAGAVALVTTVKNPIALARLVMNQTPHVLLAGSGAEQFADKMKVTLVENSYFSTEARRASWQQALARQRASEPPANEKPGDLPHGTVGCVALDRQGNLAAATSTGGLTNKMPGRVSDSAIIGAGTYAKNASCAISASGVGEQFIRNAVAAQISVIIEQRGWPLKQAAGHVIAKLRPYDGGIIGLSSRGEIVWEFNSEGMFRAAADADGLDLICIGNEEKAR